MRISMLAALALMMSIAGCKDAAHEALSKENITRELQERAARNKTPIIIDKISDAQEMTLHGERCLTAVAYVVNWPPIYFVVKIKDPRNDLSGSDIIQEIDEKGFDAVASGLPTYDGQGNQTLTLAQTIYVARTADEAKALETLDDSGRAMMIVNSKARTIFAGSEITLRTNELEDGVDTVVFQNQNWYVSHPLMEGAIVKK